MNPSEVIAFAKEKDVKFVDLKFCDIHATWQHFTVPVSELTDDAFNDGFGFDGSSIRGWQGIEASDMLVIPDPGTAIIDPFVKATTLSLVCDIEDPLTREPYGRSPRGVAKKAEEYLQSTGLGDTAYFGPEAEFFIFDDVRFDSSANEAFYSVDSSEGVWNTGRDEMPNLGHKIRHKEGYLPVAPKDQLMDLRNDMVLTMIDLGIEVEAQHHEVSTGGQAEIDLRFGPLHSMGDSLCLYKYVVKNVARRYEKTATFMPKPIFGDNGSGMHVHSSIWKGGEPTFAGDCYAGLSQEAIYYIGGLLKHAAALCAICNPTNNSYKRLVPGFEAPVNLAYSARNRSAICRIPTYSNSPKAKRVEFRVPDPSCNPYLAFSAILMAGLDGIENRIDPGDAVDKNLYDLSPEDADQIKQVPDSLKGSLDALADDHKFLVKGGVFTEDFIQNFIELKNEEYDDVRIRTHPHEYFLYYDI
ncbi:MAG: Glutamine synthetase [Candidatus Moanabacter tarae]|uniref:Glutamine synthetase n=1 Tax=Candidatus Moanibacter tarae TaxID=2200854 RepID=A0A2Z4AF43_9BACT|nr:MAG: Glutamine synthetase [Candidatus Moanabacter tarae]|tara:strand:+ start:23115 stop:24524 length:1410 start_codon:yes stop_codon:yes gene_type:complete